MPVRTSPRSSREPRTERLPSSRATARPWPPSSPSRTSTPSKTPSTGTSPGKPTVTGRESRRADLQHVRGRRRDLRGRARQRRLVKYAFRWRERAVRAAAGVPPASRAYDLASAYAAGGRSAPPGCQRQETLRVRRPLPTARRGLPHYLRGRGRSTFDILPAVLGRGSRLAVHAALRVVPAAGFPVLRERTPACPRARAGTASPVVRSSPRASMFFAAFASA